MLGDCSRRREIFLRGIKVGYIYSRKPHYGVDKDNKIEEGLKTDKENQNIPNTSKKEKEIKTEKSDRGWFPGDCFD